MQGAGRPAGVEAEEWRKLSVALLYACVFSQPADDRSLAGAARPASAHLPSALTPTHDASVVHAAAAAVRPASPTSPAAAANGSVSVGDVVLSVIFYL